MLYHTSSKDTIFKTAIVKTAVSKKRSPTERWETIVQHLLVQPMLNTHSRTYISTILIPQLNLQTCKEPHQRKSKRKETLNLRFNQRSSNEVNVQMLYSIVQRTWDCSRLPGIEACKPAPSNYSCYIIIPFFIWWELPCVFIAILHLRPGPPRWVNIKEERLLKSGASERAVFRLLGRR